MMKQPAKSAASVVRKRRIMLSVVLTVVALGSGVAIFSSNRSSQREASTDEQALAKAAQLREQMAKESPPPADLPAAALVTPPVGGPTSARKMAPSTPK